MRHAFALIITTLSTAAASFSPACNSTPREPEPSTTSSSSGGVPIEPQPEPVCVTPKHRMRCTNNTDCNTGTNFCEIVQCGEGGLCDYPPVADGTPCDPATHDSWHWRCKAGSCCPHATATEVSK